MNEVPGMRRSDIILAQPMKPAEDQYLEADWPKMSTADGELQDNAAHWSEGEYSSALSLLINF